MSKLHKYINWAIEKTKKDKREPTQTLKIILVHPKDHVKPYDKCAVIYSVKCKDCNGMYFGETGRTLKIK